MGGRMRGLGWGLALLTIMMVSGRSAMGATFHSSEFGYNLTLPDDWQQIPPDVVQRVISRIWTPKARALLVCDAAFQYRPGVRWFQYPFITVQVMRYSKVGVYEQIDADEFEKIVHALDAHSIKKSMDREVSSTARSLMTDPRFGRARLDKARRRFELPTSTYVKGRGTINGLMVGYFGHEAVVQLCFYGQDAQWEQGVAAARPILNSLHFDPDKDFVDATIEHSPGVEHAPAIDDLTGIDHSSAIEHSQSEPSWLDAAEKGFAGGVAVLVIAAICFMMMQFLKSKA